QSRARHAPASGACRGPRAVGGGERAIELWPSVAEQPPAGALDGDGIEIEAGKNDGLRLLGGGYDLPGGAGDEGMAIEANLGALARLDADPVRGDKRDDIRSGMTLHHPPPMTPAVQARSLALRTRGGPVEQDLRPLQGHAARAFGKPLVPADAHADAAVRGGPDAKAGIPGVEIVLLLIAGTIGNMGFAIEADLTSVAVDDHHRIVVRI